jgi:predicted RNase H-related nuclease YkuK (DUF458 family)
VRRPWGFTVDVGQDMPLLKAKEVIVVVVSVYYTARARQGATEFWR